MSNYRKYVELNELVYEKEVVGYRVSFYVIIPNGVTSRVLYKKCDTFEKNVATSVTINRVGNKILLKLVGDTLVSGDEKNVVEVNSVKEMKMYEKKFNTFYTNRVELGEKTKEVGKEFLQVLRNTMGYDMGEADCEEVSVRYLGGYGSWIHKECDDDFPDFKKDAGKKLKSILKDFNKGLHGFKVDDGVLSEKAWLYFGIVKK